jgi:putative tricarboxylic transport membrane protein
MTHRAACIAIFTAVLISSSNAVAGFPEKNIEFIIPYSAGGGFDRTVRSVAPFMEKYLPNKVSVLPKNLPGAGGRKGANVVYRAKPDGYTIGIFNMPGFIIPAVLGNDVGYDLSKVTWLGRVEATQYALVVNAKSEFKTLADLLASKRPVKFVATGFGSSALAAAQIVAHVMGIKATFLPGYKSAPEYMIGLVRGDGDVAMATIETATKFTKTGDARVLVSFEPKSSFKGVPTISSTKFSELSGLGIDRVVGAPPNLDPHARALLVDALAKTLKDPAFIAQAHKVRITLDPLGPEETKKTVVNSVNVYEKYKSVLKLPN